jgi:hypothetical protein
MSAFAPNFEIRIIPMANNKVYETPMDASL